DFTISVTDTAGNSGSQAYTVAIAGVALSISPTDLPPASINGPYSQPLTVTGGSGTGYSCVVSAGALPAGITLDTATCTLSGQATTVGSYSFTITATDSAGNTGSRSYSLEVLDELTLTPSSLPGGTFGVAYSQTVLGVGGNGSYTYEVTAGALPNGLSLDGASGAITGTPSLVDSFDFTITVTDGLGDTASQAYTVAITGVALTLDPATLEDGEVGLAYSQVLTVTGGSGSGYACEVTDGALPAGITLDAATCTLSGTPTTEGAYSFTITATDSAGNSGSQAYSLQIGAALVITITPATLPDGESGEAYSEQLSADGGVAPYTYSVSAGALPAGLTLNGSTGVISGTPTVFGDFSFTVTATDADGRVGSQAYTLTIEGRPDPTRDPELIGMIDGQFGLARRFGEGQIMNVMRHLEGNRSAFRCGLSADLGLSGDNDSRGRNALNPEDNQARSGVTLGTSGSECDETLPKFGYWVSGSLSDDDYRGQDFTSDALSAGIDFKFSDKLMAGAAVGFGWGESEFGSNGTQSDADATTFMAYLSYNPAGRLYVEAMIGGGDLSIDSDRYVSYDGSMVSGSRNGSLTMGSIGLAGDMIDSEKVLLTGYLRYDMVKIDLDRYEESGSTQLALGFGAADQTVNSLVLGGRAAYTLSRSWGLLTPMVRAEYRMRTVGDYRQDMAYLDLPGIEYSLRQGSDNEGSLSLSLGFEALIQGWTLGMEYGSNPLSSSGMSGDMVRATVRYGF
ncbi:MAG: putative Ig domain-containing protein, partial [Steroidobacteraceae bacterium]